MLFVNSCLDPQPYKDIGGSNKEDYLKRQSILRYIKFLDCPMLYQLVCSLTDLFWFHYDAEPTQLERAAYEAIKMVMGESNMVSEQWASEVINDHYCARYDDSTLKLKSHAATIKLFETALNCSEWPEDPDPAMRQVYKLPQSQSHQSLSKPTHKTNFKSTVYNVQDLQME